jgi:CubicO group peptidase (beta-lactamase class C family)
MNNSTYLPPNKLWPSRAPTEVDNNLRHRLVQGEVHDENAFAIGGVSGHAGLFSTAPDLAAFCQMLLNGGVYAHSRILRRSTIAQFTTPQELSNRTRTLGWVVPSEGGFSGHFYGPNSFVHTGFKVTCIWIDPHRQLFVVLLTNRVHPTRENQKIAKIRPALHDAVLESLGLANAAAAR